MSESVEEKLVSLTMSEFKTFQLGGDWQLQSGQTIPNAFIAYKTFGDPSAPAIIYPTWYSGCKFDLCIP